MHKYGKLSISIVGGELNRGVRDMCPASRQVKGKAVPLQPEMVRLPDYEQRLVRWNPYAKKNQALCSEFETGAESQALEMIPDACVHFLFKCDEDDPQVTVTGVLTKPCSIELDAHCTYFDFKPYSVSGMLPLEFSWKEIVDQAVAFSGDEARELFREDILDELIGLDDFATRSERMCRFAETHLTNSSHVPDFVDESELFICANNGNLRMHDVGENVGYTDRWCRERFKDLLGVSLKRYSSIMRFQSAAHMLVGPADCSLSDVTFRAGYFDQSHLSRDFKKYAGVTPLQFKRAFAV